MMRVYACKQLQVQITEGFIHKPSGINNSEFLVSIGSMVSGQFCSKSETSKAQREGQIITEYLAVLVESRIE